MESNWAAEHLQVIRTLMERSAIYRRALAPVMLLLGALGAAAAILGITLPVPLGPAFGWFWIAVSALGVSGAYLMVRRQAFRDSESFWSPPTRRVTQAVLPPLACGLVAGLIVAAVASRDASSIRWLPPAWMVLYGCALHAAGFFMPRGIKLFGWGFAVLGCLLGAALAFWEAGLSANLAHGLMGAAFGGPHLAYGAYLYFTESTRKEA